MPVLFDEIADQDVALAVGGNARARQGLVAILAQPVFNLARRMLPSDADAEDATQEALVKILAGLASFRGESKFSTWAWSVATRAIIDFRRGAFRGPLYGYETFAADLADGLDPGAHERVEDCVELGQLLLSCSRALLMCLDADHRAAYILGEILEFDGATGAEICGVEPGTFRKRLSRARQQIHGALERQCGVVNPGATCRCHRRLARARQRGRVGEGPHVSVDRLRRIIHELEDLSERCATYYRADPGAPPPADLLASVQAL